MNDKEIPIGFDETPPEAPEVVTGAQAVPCCDHVPRTICPPLTNGGRIRSMDNHQLAAFLADTDMNDVWDLGDNVDAWLEWLNQPVQECRQGITGGGHADIS